MKRLAINELVQWKSATGRKPLVLHGARQVGKTYLLQTFGKEHFPHTHYFNFEKNRQIHSIFERDLDPRRIISELELLLKASIAPSHLLIFDEIQECPKALTALKYFYEDAPEYHLCCAGSLLGVRYNEQASYPVGKTTTMHLYPMNFEEFCTALGEERIVDLINVNARKSIAEITIPEAAHLVLWELMKKYMITGGLPAVVSHFSDATNLHAAFEGVRRIQTEIISNYLLDIAKHSGRIKAINIERVFRSVPSQLAKEQNRYRFTNVIPGRTGFASLSDPIDWLVAAGLVHKTMIANEASLPLMAYTKENSFKLYLFDVGLLGALSEIPPQTILAYDYGRFKGYFAENLVATEFMSTNAIGQLYSWAHGTSEIEFLREINGAIIPVEVKAGINTKSQSLRTFCSRHNPPFGLILSAMNCTRRGQTTFNLPLYFASKISGISG
jgi:predicted AAA+ superfamily ATPase